MTIRIGVAATRRRFLATSGAAAALTTIGSLARPYISRANDRPLITFGVQSGDVSLDSGVIWARSDRASRMLVEIATTDSFKDIRAGAFVDALPESDFTAKTVIDALPPGQQIFYRVRFADLASPTIVGEPQVGQFRTAPSD
jgi:alkaline phosphatase D